MARGDDSFFPAYVSVAERKLQAAKAVRAMEAAGKRVSPVTIVGKKITTTFWGDAWCSNLERFGDYSSRIERGKRYARNGSVIDLQIDKGQVRALVSGSSIYKIKIGFQTLAADRWAAIKTACGGQIESVVELLSGAMDKGVMEIVTRAGDGLFPVRNELTLACSCPDFTPMCKHIAAALYGVGARFDTSPELVFLLRGVDPSELVDAALAAGKPRTGRAPRGRVLDSGALSSVFGVDIDIDLGGASPGAELAAAVSGRGGVKPAAPKAKAAAAAPEPKAKAAAPKTKTRRGEPAIAERQDAPMARPAGPLACAVIHAFPLESPKVVAVVDVERRVVSSFMGDDLKRLRSGLAAYDVLVGVDVEAVIGELSVEPGPYRLIELGPTPLAYGQQPGYVRPPTIQERVEGTCHIWMAMRFPSRREEYLARGDAYSLRRLVEAEAKVFAALFSYGRLHGAVRARIATVDRWFPVPWSFNDGTSLDAIKEAALAAGDDLEVVLGGAPGWDSPWVRARRVQVQRSTKDGEGAVLFDSPVKPLDETRIQCARLTKR